MKYWLLDWLDDESLTSIEGVTQLLKSDSALERAIEFASNHVRDDLVEPPGGKTLVAGNGLDLSGWMSCTNPICIRKTADQLVQRSWFFFDHVVVIGLDPWDIIHGSAHPPRARQDLISHSGIALYVREIGAEDFFAFRRRPHFCMDHLDQHAQEVGLGGSATELAAIMHEQLRSGGRIQLLERENKQMYVFQHPALEYMTTGNAKGRGTADELLDVISEQEAKRVVAGLTTSVWSARENKAALGQSAWANSKVFEPPSHVELNAGDVAFNVQLPTLEGVSSAKLLSLRAHERHEFEALRGALTATIEERIAAMPASDSRAIGEAVVSDVLQPEISRLHLRMESAAGLFGKRSIGAVTTGSLLTTVGLLAFAPLVVPGVVLGVGGLLGSYNAYAKASADIEMSDLHILWRAGSRPHA